MNNTSIFLICVISMAIYVNEYLKTREVLDGLYGLGCLVIGIYILIILEG